MLVGKIYLALILAIFMLVNPVLSQQTGTLVATFLGTQAYERVGYWVNKAGDVNGDGYDDFMIANYHTKINGYDAGAVYLILGRSNSQWGFNVSLEDANARFLGRMNYEALGYHVGGGGDINGDGYDDIIIGAPAGNPSVSSLPGTAYIIFGKSTVDWGMNAVPYYSASASYEGEAAGSQAGKAVAIVGDVNGDGFDDFLMSAPFFDGYAADGGKVYLILGRSSSWKLKAKATDCQASFISKQSNNQAGYMLAGAGDVNGDGLADMIIGAPQKGNIYLVFGRQNANWGQNFDLYNSNVRITGGTGSYSTGWIVTSAGDVNNDGFDDILITAPSNSQAGSEAGKIFLLYGKATWESSINLTTSTSYFLGESATDNAGWSANGVGDIDGDGYADFMIGAWHNDHSGLDAGKAYYLNGKSSPFTATALSSVTDFITGETDSAFCGFSVAGVGDVNKDNVPDFVISSPYYSQKYRWGGKISLYLGKKSGPQTPLLAVNSDTIRIPLSATNGVLTVNNEGFANLDWQAQIDAGTPWLTSIAPSNGTVASFSTQELVVDISRSSLSPGNYQGIVHLTSNGGNKDVVVTMDVAGPAQLSASTSMLDFGSVTAELTFELTNMGGELLSWNINTSWQNTWIQSVSPDFGTLNAGESQTIIVLVSRFQMAEGNYQQTLSINSNGGSHSLAINMSVPKPEPFEKRINSGGSAFTDHSGNSWVSDQAYTVGGFGYVGGQTYTTSDFISGTSAQGLYKSERWGMTAYQFDVPAGIYEVTLHFAELYYTATGKRIFSVQIENQEYLTKLDLFREVGHDVAVAYTFSNIAATDGRLDITFQAFADAAKISGIEVRTLADEPRLAVTPTVLDFASDQTALNFTIKNEGTSNLVWTASEAPDVAWITGVQPVNGTISPGQSQIVTTQISRENQAPGNYTNKIQIDSDGGSQSVDIKMTIPGPAVLEVSPLSLDFGLNLTKMTFNVTNSGSAEMSWALNQTWDSSWITSVLPINGTLSAGQSQIVTVDINRTNKSTGDYSSNIEINSNGGNQSVTVTMSVAPPAPYSARINAGNGQFTDKNGNVWVADQAYQPGGFGYVGGRSYSTSHYISGTSYQGLYKTERYGMPAYSFDVPNGQYQVILHFAELYYTANDKRVFHVAIENQTVLSNLDIFKLVGHDVALSRTFSNIMVTDGTLDVTFTPIKDSPKISGIEIVQTSAEPILAVDPTALNFGSTQTQLGLLISNPGVGTLTWTAVENPDQSWIQSISPASGSLNQGENQSVIVSIDRTGLNTGTYSGIIEINSNGGTKSIPVEMSIAGPPQLTLSSNLLDLGSSANEATFTIQNSGGGALNWTLQENPDVNWITSISLAAGTLTADQTASIKVQISRSGVAAGDYTGTLSINWNGTVQNITVKMNVPDLSKVAFRINAGGPSYTDAQGNIWSADQAYTTGGFGYNGGSTYKTTDPIKNTTSPTLYQTEHYGMTSYRFDVPNGTYQVILHLAEIYATATYKRVFDISIESQLVLDDLDIYKVVGHDVALVYTYDNIQVSDGNLEVSFKSSREQPKISAIEVIPQTTGPTLAISPDALHFGISGETLSFSVHNTGTENLTWSAAENPEIAWLVSISPANGSVPGGANQSVTVTINRTVLTAGVHSGTIQITSNGGNKSIPVDVTIPGPPILSLSPTLLDFGATTAELKLNITNSGGSPLSWKIIKGANLNWITSVVPDTGDIVSAQTMAITIKVDRTNLAVGDYSGTLTVGSNAGNQTVNVKIQKAAAIAYSQRINAGGDIFTDVDGNIWAADQAYQTGGFGYVGGKTYSTGDLISGTSKQPLYKSERWGMTAYQFDVPNGKYKIVLHFAELYFTQTLKRIFSVAIEGQTVLNKLDIFQKAGHDVALSFTYSDIQVTDGTLNITFTPSADSPKISAIEVIAILDNPVLNISPTILDFGSTLTKLSCSVMNDGVLPLTWQLAESPDKSWITSITPSSGTISGIGSQNVEIVIDRTELAQGTYSGKIQATSNGGTKEITVNMNIPGAPELSVTPTSLDFGASGTEMSVTVKNAGGGLLSWKAVENPDKSWITSITPASGSLTSEQSENVVIKISRAGLAEGSYSGTISVSSDESLVNLTVQMTVALTPIYTQRVNCGSSKSFTDTEGKIWEVDKTFSTGSWGAVGGSLYSRTDPIANTNDDPMYQTERWGMSSYKFTVENGSYEVSLLFAELYFTLPNKRIFSVKLEGNTVLSNYDIFADVGHDVATSKTFKVDVSDGQLNIDFIKSVDDPKISGIQVLGYGAALAKENAEEEKVVEEIIPTKFYLYPNYPNPFNSSTLIRYALPYPAQVNLTIFNVLGQQVRVLQEGEKNPGHHTLVWNAKDHHNQLVSSGIYFAEIEVIPTFGNEPRHKTVMKMLYGK
ncbi:FG-GAP repeat protein [candidate division KSB1 bacterium]|nr:FG-GAP repeat protein [candidate division KSB1 bacterium]